MAAKTLLSENLYSVESENDFLLTVDGEALAMIKGKSQAEKAVIVIVEQRERELKNASTRVAREKIDNGFAILTQSLGYVMNGSPVQKHIIKFIPLPSLSFEEEKVEEEPKIVQEIPVPPPAPEPAVVRDVVPPVEPFIVKELPKTPETYTKLVPYNSSEYESYSSAY
ncbi:hypothetical protein ISTM_23 [Insectomime virus]|uniref:Uncharacterized protein n=1 Tax=Tunisvirus fontaine2 TaxID=1421067 RepID=V9SE55_9VIRU|nr:hypothetical protein D1R32_gp303 [Tunisvirus fontaine2]AHA45921.1 hypothetical protein ISTM_23 [Insectomime virus]AHC55020.1 hypothetical protein TNS_ORF302 [Tunisvirus fontaine2]